PDGTPGGGVELAGAAAAPAAANGETELGLPLPGGLESEPATDRPLLDAWHASFPSTFVSAALLRKERGGPELTEEMVFADDDRKQVPPPPDFPWRCICALVITAADGPRWVGSGWLAGPRAVVTAGHCVYLHGHGGWARQVEVYPGRNADDTSLGSFTSTQ